MSQRRVVITGMGAVTPLGLDVETSWANLVAGKSGVSPITSWDATKYDCRFAAQVPEGFEPRKQFFNEKDARRADRYSQLAMASSKEAVKHAGLDPQNLQLDRVGVIVGSGIGGLESLGKQDENLLTKGPNRVSPFMIPMMISNMAAGLISMEFGFAGPNFCVVTACATSNNCVGEAWRLIRDDEADIILAGGSEAAVVPLGMSGFSAMKAMSTRNDEPQRASRPFDRNRDGFIMGEGSGILVLESMAHARARGARIYCELAGYAATCDAFHITQPDPEGKGLSMAMRRAMASASVDPSSIDYINAHGTSTPYNDKFETLAIKKEFGEHARKVAISSTKSMTGHLLGAAGGIESVICVKTIEQGVIAPTMNLEDPDPDCDLDYVPNAARSAPVRTVLSNNLGFGGQNASVVFRAM